jgi:hypothetical protein
VTDDLAVVVEDARLLVRRGEYTVVVLPHEVGRLVDALAEAAGGWWTRKLRSHKESSKLQ